MAVEIRYTPSELGDAGVVETIEGIDKYVIQEDDSITLYARNAAGKQVPVGHVKADRWDRIHTYEDTKT